MRFKFRNPKHHLVDRNKIFLEELEDCTSQKEARHFRNLYIRRFERDFKRKIEDRDKPPMKMLEINLD